MPKIWQLNNVNPKHNAVENNSLNSLFKKEKKTSQCWFFTFESLRRYCLLKVNSDQRQCGWAARSMNAKLTVRPPCQRKCRRAAWDQAGRLDVSWKVAFWFLLFMDLPHQHLTWPAFETEAYSLLWLAQKMILLLWFWSVEQQCQVMQFKCCSVSLTIWKLLSSWFNFNIRKWKKNCNEIFFPWQNGCLSHFDKVQIHTCMKLFHLDNEWLWIASNRCFGINSVNNKHFTNQFKMCAAATLAIFIILRTASSCLAVLVQLQYVTPSARLFDVSVSHTLSLSHPGGCCVCTKCTALR